MAVGRGAGRYSSAIGLLAGLYTLLGGAISFAGWALDIPRLTDWNHDGISIQPNPSVLLVLAGAALILSRFSAQRIVLALGAIIALAGSLTLLQYIVGADFGFNHQLTFGRSWGGATTITPGRMGPPASISFTFIGSALMLLAISRLRVDRAGLRRFVPVLGVAVSVIALFSLVGYIFGAKQFYSIPWLTAIALQTGTFLMAMAIGLVVGVPERQPMLLLRERSGAGAMARAALPGLIVLIPLVLFLRVQGQEMGMYDVGTSRALGAVILILTTVSLLWIALLALQRHDQFLRDSEARYRSLFEVSVHGILTIDERGIIDSANASAERIFGWSADEMSGRHIAMLMPEPFHSRHDSYLGNYLHTGQRKIIGIGREVIGLRKDGSTFPVDLAVSEFVVGGKRRFLGAVADITERKRAEEAVRESEARLRTVIDQLPAGVGVMDTAGAWLLTNSAMQRFVPQGIASTRPERAARWRFWHDQGDPIPPENWPGQRALRGEAVLPGLEGLYRDDDGREIWMRVSAAPLRNAAGEIIGATTVVQDIDLNKRFQDRLQEELGKRTSEVQQAAKAVTAAHRMAAVGAMASGLAHDLKNVLMPLSARMDSVLTAPALEGEARTDLAVVVALIDHLRQMARNLELFARDPEQEGTEGVTQLAPWCRRVQGLLESSLDAGGRRADGWIRLKCDVPDGLPAVGIAPHRLTQSVLNLVHNARDAIMTKSERRGEQGSPAGAITVEARATEGGSAVALKVIDDGAGMDDETMRRCMEPFFTTKDRLAAAGLGGSGLGMALVHAIAERVGGRLHVESEVGRGTIITMILPTARPEPAASTPIGRARVSIEDKRTRAIVIETLRSLRYETLDGQPERDSPSIAWVTDGASAKPEQAAWFLRLRPGQRVVVLGGDDGWRTAGAIVCELAGVVATLRQVLAPHPIAL